jgi:hypothetical protein
VVEERDRRWRELKELRNVYFAQRAMAPEAWGKKEWDALKEAAFTSNVDLKEWKEDWQRVMRPKMRQWNTKKATPIIQWG